MQRALGKLLAYAAMALLLFVLIAVAAFFVECASWRQCPTVGKGPGSLQLQKPSPNS